MEPKSKSANPESVLKKRLQNFLQELQRWGTVAGFKHFNCYVRGREELVVNINNSLQGSSYSFSTPASRKQSMCYSDSLTSSQLPYDKRSLVLSHNSQMGLSGLRERGVGLPPASPSEQESTEDTDSTLFLIAGYARYSCPYVWVRSNHDRLFKLSGDVDSDKDSPLRLKSTAKWKDGDVHVLDILAEMVKLCTYPAPRNPFEVDLDYFRRLAQPDCTLSSGAMLACLQKLVIGTSDSKPYAGKVFEELHHVSKLHFSFLQDLLKTFSIPASPTSPAPQPTQQPTGRSKPRHPQRSQYSPPPPAVGGQPAMMVNPTEPVNTSRGVTYGQGARGAFPGGFERMPAPSLF